MKKYFLGILAVVFALGLSAYTAAKKSHGKTISQTPYFWYQVDGAGKISSAVLNSGGEEIKDDVIEGGANQLTTCSDLSSMVCLAGSTSPSKQLGSNPDTETASHDNRIRRD